MLVVIVKSNVDCSRLAGECEIIEFSAEQMGGIRPCKYREPGGRLQAALGLNGIKPLAVEFTRGAEQRYVTGRLFSQSEPRVAQFSPNPCDMVRNLFLSLLCR